jgi:hypothetical protein
MTPRAHALTRAAALAAETAARSTNSRHHEEAKHMRELAKAEIERLPGTEPPEKTRRSDKTWRWW